MGFFVTAKNRGYICFIRHLLCSYLFLTLPVGPLGPLSLVSSVECCLVARTLPVLKSGWVMGMMRIDVHIVISIYIKGYQEGKNIDVFMVTEKTLKKN